MRRISDIPRLEGEALRTATFSIGVESVPGETNSSLRRRAMQSVRRESMSNPRTWRWWFTLLWTWPMDVITLLVVLLLRVLVGHSLHWEDGIWVELKEGTWFDRLYRYEGGTIAHGGILKRGCRALPHELTHVEQIEATMLSGFILGLSAASTFWFQGVDSWVAMLVIFLIVWIPSWAVSYFSSVAQAWIRGERYLYHGSHLEESAYAQDYQRNNRPH